MRSSGSMLAIFAIAALAMPAPAAAESATWHRFRGQIFTSTEPLPDPAGSDAAWQKDLKKAHKTTFTQDGGAWVVHFIAFLKQAAGANEVNIVFYDITKGKPDQVHYIPFNVDSKQTTLKSSFKLGPDDPVKAGHKYDVRLTRIAGRREVILARVTLSFK